MATQPGEEPDFKDQVMALVRALAQGRGLSREAIKRENGAALFGDMDEGDVLQLIHFAVNQLADMPHTKAIRNALGLGEFQGETLTERRDQFVKAHGMSGRTLIRHEQGGAGMLAEVITDAGRGEKITKSRSKILQLEEAIHDLQTVLGWMINPSAYESPWAMYEESVEDAKRRVLEAGIRQAGLAVLLKVDVDQHMTNEELVDILEDEQAAREYQEELRKSKPSSESQLDQD